MIPFCAFTHCCFNDCGHTSSDAVDWAIEEMIDAPIKMKREATTPRTVSLALFERRNFESLASQIVLAAFKGPKT